MAAECTHGLAAVAAGNVTTAEELIANLELPARGELWRLHGLTAQVVRQTATAAELIGGKVILSSRSGDITPDPGPSEWPVYESGSFLGTTADASVCPLHKYDLDLQAAGKANVRLNSQNDIAPTVLPYWAAGIQFGPDIPAPPAPRHCDSIRSTGTLANRTAIGTITLSEKAERIVGIYGTLIQDGVLVTAESLMGFFDLQSDDTDLIPSQWLFNAAYGAGLGATIEGGIAMPPMPHIVDIPVAGGSRINVFATAVDAPTNAANVAIYLFYV